ncbi:MAG: hypothetical protein B6244_14910 [Candidatus Cloacimonetes bacterium 4572_55]|nr:MAG: hypothetical protein B6244_14910 [Candidatus Cloacimonetes bacterium 4572_55]
MCEQRYKPERIYHVSKTQLSVARHWGQCTYNGALYHYDAVADMLTRDDIFKENLAQNKQLADDHKKAEKERFMSMQKDLF